jgi:hypothetical protein
MELQTRAGHLQHGAFVVLLSTDQSRNRCQSKDVGMGNVEAIANAGRRLNTVTKARIGDAARYNVWGSDACL